MREVTETITISKERHDELLKKEFAFDTYKRKIKNDKYLTDLERALFVDEEKVDVVDIMLDVIQKANKEEEDEAIFTDEEWDEITAMTEEKEEDNGTENV